MTGATEKLIASRVQELRLINQCRNKMKKRSLKHSKPWDICRSPMSEKKKPKKIIWITIDTLRADHLGCYGYKRNTSPIVDALSKESILFKWAFSTCSYTMPSHASMFTSRYPAEHSTGFSNGPPVKPIDNDLFLAEVLSSQGYETAAFVSAMVLSRKRGVGIHSGFKTYNDTMTRSELNRPNEPIRSGKETNSEVFKWLEANHENDFFLFIDTPPVKTAVVIESLKSIHVCVQFKVDARVSQDFHPSTNRGLA